MQKFLRTLTLLALLVVPWVGWGQTSVMIGDTAAAVDDSYLPMNSLYEYSYSQQIYTADEIGMSGTITSITLWLKGNANLYTMPFDIYMLETENESFASNTDWIPVTASDIVFSDSITVHHTNYQAYTFDLTTPFDYSGNGNLVICFDNNTGQWKSGLNGRVNTVTDGTIMAIYARQDGTDYDPLNMTGITATGTLAKRNVIVLDILPAGSAICEKPATLTVVDLSAHEVSLTWASTSADSYQFEFKAATDTTWVLMTPDNYPGLGIIIPNLQQNTTYNARVRSVCGTEYSGYRTLTFTTPIACPVPTDLTATLTPGDGTIAVINWHETGEATQWQLCLDNDTTDLIDVYDTTYTFPDLTPEQTYTIKVRAVCGDEDGMSEWSNSISFTPTDAYSITVNDGTSTNGLVPIYGYWCDNTTKSQFIIPAEELTGMAYGTINQLTFYASNNNVSWGNAQFEVYMTEVNETTLSSLIDYTSMDQVMTAAALAIVDNQMVVTLTTPYQYMGGNLMIGVLQTTSGSYVSCNWLGVSATGASMGGYGSSISQQNFLPKTTFSFTPGEAPSCERPGPLAVGNITAHTADVAWTAGGDETSWNVYLNDELEATVNTPEYTLSGLAGETTYTVAVTSVCGGSESNQRVASFTTLISCSVPTGLTATMTPGDGTTATIGWHEVGTATQWQICLNNDTTDLIDVYDSSYTFTDLIPEQTYTVKVRANCGDEDGMSAWSSELTFQPTEKTVIGSGSATNGYLPTYTYYNYSLTQQIYTPAELGEAGSIFSVDYYCTGDKSRDLNVYMVNTTKQSFADGYDWIPVTANDLVFSGTVNFTANAWTTITLNDPFAYDGVSNLAIIFDDNTGSYVSAPSFLVFSDTNRAIRIYDDYTDYDPYAPSSYSGTVLNVKNQIRLEMGDAPTCSRPTDLVVEDATANTVTLSWADTLNSGASYSVYEMTATGETLIASGINTTTYTVTGLNAQTAYVFGVVANCSADEASMMATISAATECEGGNCNIYIYAQDGWGDGWNGAAISVMQGAVTTYSMPSQNLSSTIIYDTATISVCAGAPINFSWSSGQYDSEISFGIANANGEVVFNVTNGMDLTSGETFFIMESCTAAAPTKDVTIAVNDATMGTTVPAPGTYQYTLGSVVEITATPANGYVMAGWIATYSEQGTVESDTLFSNDPDFVNPLEIYISNDIDDLTITALFELGIPDTINECTVMTLPFTETFDEESATLDCWTLVDADGDGYTWNLYDFNGAPVFNSRSYDNNIGALTPDNWLITPQIVLPTGSNYEVTWKARPQDVNYPGEHYGLFISTTSTATSAFTMLQQWTLTSNDVPAMPVVDLSAYAGQTIYLALRHWNCTDMYWLVVDDFTVREQLNDNQVLVTVNSNNAFYGSVDGGGVYTIGDSVTVTATPAASYTFYNWTNNAGSVVSTANPYTFVASANTVLTANFGEDTTPPVPDTVSITIAVNDSTMGTTTPAPGTYQYVDTAVVALNATANAGYHFKEWSASFYLSDGSIGSQTFAENPIYFNASNLVNFSPLTFTAVFEEDLDCIGSTCNLVINGSDSYGDGWNNGILQIMQNNVLVSTFVVDSTVATANVEVCSDYPVDFIWTSGSYDDEVYFAVNSSNGTTIFTVDGANTLISGNVFATVTNPCTSPVVTFNHDSVAITIAINDATMGTVTPAPGTYQYLDSDTLFIIATANTGAHFVEWQVTYVWDGALETISISGASHGYLCSGFIGYQNLTFTAIFESDTVSELPIECTGNTCFVTIEGEDSYGDGWNGGELLMYQHDTLIATFTLADDFSFSQTFAVCSDYPVEFIWTSGSYDDEISFTVSNSNGAIFNIPDGSLLAGYDVFATVSNVCDANASVVYNMDIDSLTVTLGVNDATMGSITPAPGTYHISTLDVMTVTATPNTGYYFIGWAYSYNYEDTLYYDTSYSSALNVVDIEGSYWAEVTPVSFTALFSTEPYLGDGMQVNIAVNDATMGTTNPAPGTHYFYMDEIPSVVAIPNNGYHIAGWTLQVMHPDYGYVIDTTVMYAIDDVFSLFEDEEGPLVVTEDLVDYVWDITAIFESGEPAHAMDSLTIITEVNDATMGTITPAPGTHYYVAGDVVSLGITAYEGYELSGVHVVSTHPLYGTIVDEIYSAAEMEEVFGETLTVEESMYGYVFHFTAIFVRSNSIEDANMDNVTISSTENMINVRGAEGRQVVLYDVNGRLISYEAKATENVTFRVSSTGVYLVKVGNAPARRVVVMR